MRDDPSAGSDRLAIERSRTEPARFAAIFDRHFVTIHRYLARRVGTTSADDLAGESFRIAFERRHRFDRSYESALPWLYGIATNLLRNHRRKEERLLELRRRAATASVASARTAAGVDEQAVALADAAITAPVVAGALLRLTAGDRDALVLFAVEELSYAEVAVALGIPVGTVRSRISRARAQLRELLGPDGQAPVDHLTTEELHHG